MKHEIFIITGDIIQSTSILKKDRSRFIKELKVILKETILGNEHYTSFSFTRGDSFQVALENDGVMIEMVLKIRAALRKLELSGHPLDARLGIGYGLVSFKRAKLEESDGPVFHFAATALEQCYDGISNMYFKSTNTNETDQWNIILELTENIVGSWTVKEATFIYESLNGLTQVEIAQKHGVGQSTVQRGLKRAGWAYIRQLLDFERKTFMQTNGN